MPDANGYMTQAEWDAMNGYSQQPGYQAAMDERARNQAAWQEQANSKMATGPFDPRTMSEDDKYYLAHMATQMNFDPRYLGQGLFFGPDVGQLGSQKYYGAGPANDLYSLEQRVNPAIVAAIRGMASGDPNFMKYFGGLGDPNNTAFRGKEWASGWDRAHQGGAVWANGNIARQQAAWNQLGGPAPTGGAGTAVDNMQRTGGRDIRNLPPTPQSGSTPTMPPLGTRDGSRGIPPPAPQLGPTPPATDSTAAALDGTNIRMGIPTPVGSPGLNGGVNTTYRLNPNQFLRGRTYA